MSRSRLSVLGGYLVLLALVIPWYWPAADARQYAGLPLWALATLGALALTAAFTAWLYLAERERD